jgi:hypothetical protein
MRLEALLCALVILADPWSMARADLVGHPAGPPPFSAADTEIINRNELLRAIAESDPWLVRHILDLMMQRRGNAPAEGVDPAKNPDLAAATRTAEGSVEWFELLKRARAEKEARGKDSSAMSGRSAEGSVELIEMMKRAKALKDAGRK